MTSYFHILRSGDFCYFLQNYGNLYLLLQYGWENVNGRFKRTIHKNTQNGGDIGGSSKLEPVIYTMMRVMLWNYWYLHGLFHHLGHTGELNVDFGDVKVIPQITKETDALTRIFADTILKFGSFVGAFSNANAGLVLDVVREMEAYDNSEETA